ncbi:F-box/LRR-repeat protein 8-like isoform X2 [Haliotis rubra]|nr:F-box/LRR-repeat protein 8-like isoform X2 [Haliotis rubra]XP_046544124.1 F-box/LRR-repeat protein 8-like isoform X2 [Haliotis rubra]
MDTIPWNTLPDHAIITILSYLSREDSARAGTTCTTWHRCYRSPQLWHTSTLNFQQPRDGKSLLWLAQFAQNMRTVRVLLNQHETENRRNACEALDILSNAEGRQLMKLCIEFTGDNPLFLNGQDFVDALKALFDRHVDSTRWQLKHVQLSGLAVSYDTTVFDSLSENNPLLQFLDISNNVRICKVPPDCVERLVDRCRGLKHLALFHCSLTDQVLESLAQSDRVPLGYLGITCRWEQAYIGDLSSEAWSNLTSKCPNLRVGLIFTETCPLHKISVIMKPELPVRELRFEISNCIFKDEVDLAARVYSKTLEKVVLQTEYYEELGDNLINLCTRCKRLTSLMVHCALKKMVVDTILAICPVMKDRGTYLLKWEPEPEVY